MSDDLETSAAAYPDSNAGGYTPIRRDRTRGPSRTVEWVRTIVACGLLLVGLVTILPMLPDKDSRGVFSSEKSDAAETKTKPATTSMLTTPDGSKIARDVLAAQPASTARRIHRT